MKTVFQALVFISLACVALYADAQTSANGQMKLGVRNRLSQFDTISFTSPKYLHLMCGNHAVNITKADHSSSTPSNLSLALAVVAFNGSEMITVHGGTFTMGSYDGKDWQNPAHRVTVSTFRIGKYEITNAQYAAYLNAIGASRKGSVARVTYLQMKHTQISYRRGRFVVDGGKESYPVVCVTWDGAKGYCEYYGGRLPTEAEWEFAASGGNSSNGYTYSGSHTLDSVGWYKDNSKNLKNDMYNGKGIHTVGTKCANELGIHDMSGNVWEWCSDWYGSYSSSLATTPQEYTSKYSGTWTIISNVATHPHSQRSTSGSHRVLRGGSWGNGATSCRVVDRRYGSPSYSYNNIGFRLAVSSP